MKKAVLISFLVLAFLGFVIMIILGSGGLFLISQAQEEARAGNHCAAFKLFNEVFNRQINDLFRTRALDGLSKSLHACSQELTAAEKPCEALGLIITLERSSIPGINETLYSEAYNETLLLCSQSDGNDGKQILQDTYEQFCEHNGTVDQRHPAVGMHDGKKIWSPWIYQNIPYARNKNDIFATDPGELRFLLCDNGAVVQYVDTCHYTEGKLLMRYKTGTHLGIIDILSGDKVVEADVFNEPIACPVIHTFPSQSTTDKTYGPPPTTDMIKDWIFMQMEGLLN